MDLYDHIYHRVCRQVYQESAPSGHKNRFKEDQEDQNGSRKLRQPQKDGNAESKPSSMDVIPHQEAGALKVAATPRRNHTKDRLSK